MKKILSALLAIVMVVSCMYSLTGCSKSTGGTFDIVMITDGATISDGEFNQNAWEGVEKYASENNMTCRYYQPALNDDGKLDNIKISEYIKLAVDNGAKYIVLPGEKFAVAAYENATIYKDINFVLVDAIPTSVEGVPAILNNVMSIKFDELQAGYLAGFSAVVDGFTSLGFFGSYKSDKSNLFGTGFAQGAGSAADTLGIPVVLEYAEADNPFRNYNYSFNIEPVYKEIPTNDGNKYYTVNVVDGIGSGTYKDGENVTVKANPAPKGKIFDHWEVKSDSKGVKDRKVNISSSKTESLNLIVEKCDCTLTAIYADAETVDVLIADATGKSIGTELSVPVNSTVDISAPAARSNMTFDHWECDDPNAIEDVNSADTRLTVTDTSLKIVPQYVLSDKPTFDVTVKNGTGSGSYSVGESIEIVADAPEKGMMFDHWKNADSNGDSTGVEMENEYKYITSFEMIDRFAAIPEKMYDSGVNLIFNPCPDFADSVFTAGKNFDYDTYTFGAGVDHSSWSDCWACVVTDYGKAIQLSLSDFKGGSVFKADCSNECIYVSDKSVNATYTDGDGNEQKDENYNKYYAATYKRLANGKIKLVQSNAGVDIRKTVKSKCLTVNFWVQDGAYKE